MIGHLAEAGRAALAYVSPAGTQWIVTSNACACSQQGGKSVSCLAGGTQVEGRQCKPVDLWYKNRSAGKLAMCCDARAHPAIETTMCQVAYAALRQVELEKETESLRADLSSSQECLQAVYDINASPFWGQKPGELLDQILARGVAFHAGLRASFWMLNGPWLEQKARKNAAPSEARAVQHGLLGKVIASAKPVSAPSRADLAALAPSEPELAQATSAAILPVRMGQQVVGALEVWEEGGQSAFDARGMQLLTTLASLIGMSAEAEKRGRPSPETERLRLDMDTAATIQQTLLLGRPTMDLQSLRANAATIPSLAIGGDFYDFFAYDQVLDVVIGDVMGKGIPAALLGAATKNHLVRAINYLLASHPGQLPEPKEILAIVNAEVFRQLAGIERFVTLVFARFDLRKRQVQLIDCGHTRTVHARKRGAEYSLLQGENTPLGFSRAETYNEITAPLGSGDIFFFCTDGVTEARRAGEDFGERRLAELICSLNHLDPKDLVEKVGMEVISYSGAQPPKDDLTCVAVKIEDLSPTIASRRDTLEIPSVLGQLPVVRAFLRDLCRQTCNIATVEEDLAQLELAVTEVISNIIRHAYHGQADGRIRLEVNLFVNRFLLRIYHRGEAFDPAAVETPSPDVAPHKGLNIIRQCVDNVQYARSKHGENCVFLQKILKR
jgi:sigma-B regulation protein RsbU (phosphoserine phosphatase)